MGLFWSCLSRAIRDFSDYNRKKLIPTIGPRGDPLKNCWYCVFTAIAHESAMGDLCTYSRAFRGYSNINIEKRCFMYCDPPGPSQVMHICVHARRYSFVCTDSCVQDRRYRSGCTHSCVQVRTYRFLYLQTRTYRLVGTDLYGQTRVYRIVGTDLHEQAHAHGGSVSRAISHFNDYNRKKLIPTIGPRGDPLKIRWYCVFIAIAH